MAATGDFGVKTVALIVAAGRGSRAGTGGGGPKQYAIVAGVSILRRAIDAFLGHPGVDAVQVVIHRDDGDLYRGVVADLDIPDRRNFAGALLPPVIGGETRQDSVRLGLLALSGRSPARVLIHDAARPFVSSDVVSRVIAALADAPAAIAALPAVDTLKRASASGIVTETLARDGLWRAQTPQGFHFDVIVDGHARAGTANVGGLTDDAAIAEWAGVPVLLVPGEEANIKITTAEDMAMAEERLAARQGFETRTATGFDVHRFAAGDHVWLGGVKIAHTARLDGHSDADVVLHALTDALLGCIGAGDIGTHFPPSDPQWRGAASSLFLADAGRRVRDKGGRIVNVDVTVLAEAPKIGPHRAAMQATIGDILGLSSDRVGIKATTTEGLGFTGRREGIAAMATATVLLPA